MLQRIKSAARIRSARNFPAKLRRICLSAPVASVSFDDFARSAWTAGGEIVEAAGARATYYTSGGFCRRTIDGLEYFTEADLAELCERGHEAACHTFAHSALPGESQNAIFSDLARNAAFLRNAAGQGEIRSFAYPLGAASIRTKLLLRNRFPSCRGIEPGINAGWTDISQLRAVCLQTHFLREFSIARLVDEVCSRKGWLILIAHDVSSKPTPYGCTPNLLREAVEAVRRAGIELLPVGEVLNRLDAKETRERLPAAPAI
ncbi:MAG: polysaccharide deacetylase family protein [Rhodomicrobium sp.]